MPDTPHAARWVQSDADVAELARLIRDPQRTQLIVGVTTQPSRDAPFLDPDELARRLGERAQVWVIVASDHAWALTEALPPKIDVYGGAVRAWNPIAAGSQPYPSDHPQWTVFSADDAPRVIEGVVEYAALAEHPPPPFGTTSTATVTAVREAGAELELASGHPAFAALGHLIQHGEVFHAGDVLLPGMQVQVRVGAWHPQAGRVSVSLRDFAPDPWQRIAEVYEPGMLVEAGVTAITAFGAFVQLLPGVEGLLHKSKIADAFVEYVDDFVQEGDRITVRLLTLQPDERKAEVSLLDVPADAAPEAPASIFPGGPPWLPPRRGAGPPDAVATEALPDTPDGVLEQATQAAADAFDARLAELGASEAQAAAWSGRLRAALAQLSEAD